MTAKPTFLDEVRQQPEVLERLVCSHGSELQDRLQAAADLAQSSSLILIVGMGSSAFAGQILAQRLNGSGLKAIVCDASELLHYYQGVLAGDALMLAISQSGESAETCLAAEARHQGMPLVCVTNNEDSRLGRMADVVLPLLAGHEEGTSSKTFVATMAVLHLLADTILEESILSFAEARRLAQHMVKAMETLSSEVRNHLGQFGSFSSAAFIGRGPGLVSAMQGALITQEMTQIPAIGLSAGQFRHGPIEAAGEHLLVVVFAPSGKTSDLLVRLAQDTAEFGSPTWLISDKTVQVAEGENLYISRLPSVSEGLSPLLSIIAPELLGAAIARKKGLEPGRFQRISKVTDFE